MEKTLIFADTSPQTIKIGDTNTSLTLVCGNDNVATDLTNATSITVKLGNASGYLKSIQIDPTKLTNPKSGQVTVKFDNDLMTSLPADNYAVEVWVVDPTGTSIYPSDWSTWFTINNNIQSTNGSTITTITFDDFVKELNKAASTIKGDKGDDGLSAYQVATINGYKGSQTDWLASLVGAKGDKGDKGDAGKDFRIVKTFPSIATMNGTGFSDGDFTMIASDVNDPDDGKLYVWNGTSFTYIADLSGSQGIKGDTGKTGDKGDKGDTGDQGLSAYQVAVNAGFSGSVNQWLASIVGPKGDKGDTGTVDNTGLISAPAFQSLQAQVNNSAVGTNLLTTPFSNSDQTINDSSNTVEGYACMTPYNNLIAGSVYTFSSDVSVVGTATSIDVRPFNPTTHGTIDDSYTTFPIVDGKISGLVKPTDGYNTLLVYAGNKGNTHGNKVTFHHMKLEKGSIATDWCPNSSEILTQGDYAKIKAAIVALGGALS